jgi:hypothetical protein
VEIAAPPMNRLGPELIGDLVTLIIDAEVDQACEVLVFTDPDYFISHVDVTRIKEYRAEVAKPIGEPSIALLFRDLSDSRPPLARHRCVDKATLRPAPCQMLMLCGIWDGRR